MKIAVIGSGISGLSAAYFLSKRHKVDLFEKDDHFGGHSYTVDVEYEKNKKISVDVGFIVFNHQTYPNLINFFKENEIEIEKSNMSFSVSVKDTSIEYCGNGLNGIFANKKNLFNIKFLKMFLDIMSFYKKSSNLKNLDTKETLGNYLKKQKLSKFFIDYHLIPMVSAIWSMPPQESSTMPLKFFLNFFQNHGLFKLKNRPQWYTVKNRSRTYVNKILSKISGEYYKNYKINKIKRETNSIKIYYGDHSEFFDYEKIVLAIHADDALSLIDNPLKGENEILSNFNYKKNIAILHTDENVMPKNKKIWSSWNSKVDSKNINKNSVTYWLNLLQNLNINKNIFLTLNPFIKIDEKKIIKKIDFTHPYYNQETLVNQKKLNLIQNKKNILFCGSYFGYGFHEDGIKSSIEMVKHIND
ncbi:MAG: NAD(P)/FAD-dependent oxidoreductase [Candidatus Pelagibacter sp.]